MSKDLLKLARPVRDEVAIMQTVDDVIVNVGDPATDAIAARKFTVSMGEKMDSRGWNNFIKTAPTQEEALENMERFSRSKPTREAAPISTAQVSLSKLKPVRVTPPVNPQKTTASPVTPVLTPVTHDEQPMPTEKDKLITRLAALLDEVDQPKQKAVPPVKQPYPDPVSVEVVRDLEIPGLEFLKSEPQLAKAPVAFVGPAFGLMRANYHYVGVNKSQSLLTIVFDTRDEISNYWRPPGDSENPSYFDVYPDISVPDLKYRVAVMGICVMIGPLEISILPVVDDSQRLRGPDDDEDDDSESEE